MGLLGELTVKFNSDLSGLTSGMSQAQSAVSGFGGIVGGLALAGGAALVGMGAQAVKMAGAFQSGMTSLVTGAGEAQSNIGMVSNGVLKLATDTGTSTKQLTDGMYMIESAGFHGAAGLDVLKAAAEGAKVGSADLASVANGVTTEMTDYSSSGLTAAQATNTLVATVAAGKTHMQDLATSMSTILPTSAALHVGLNDTAAAMATMTGEGTNAASAATYLRQLLMALASPAKAGAAALASVGLTTQQVANEMKISLPATLQMITDAVGKKFPEGSAQYVAALKNIAGGSKQMQGILELTGSHLQTLKDNFTSISGAVKQGGDSIVGWNKVTDDFNFKVDKAREVVETLGIKIGTALLPIVGKIVDGFSTLVGSFSSVMAGGTGLISFFQQLAQGWKGIFADADGNSAIPGIIAAFGRLEAAGKNFVSTIGPLIEPLLGELNGLLTTVAGYMTTLVAPALDMMSQRTNALTAFLHPVILAIFPLIEAVTNLANVIGPLVVEVISWISQTGILVPIMSTLGNILGFLINVVAGTVNLIATLARFFEENQIAGGILIGILSTLAIAFIAMRIAAIIPLVTAFIEMLPIMGYLAVMIISSMVPALGAMAVAAWGAIVPFLPFILIGAAIVAVIVLIVLAVQHWGDIVKWLQIAWANVVNFFKGIWANITTFFVGVWAALVGHAQAGGNAISSWWTGLWNGIVSAAKVVWGVIVNIVKFGAQLLYYVIFGPFLLIVGLFEWLYNHNYYFKDLVDAIVGFFQAGLDWIQQAWQATIDWLVGLWAGTEAAASSAWQAITDAIMSVVTPVVAGMTAVWNNVVSALTGAWNAFAGVARAVWTGITTAISTAVTVAVTFLQTQWNIASTYLQGIWNTFVTGFRIMWALVSAIFSSIWATYISRPLASVWTQISGWFTQLANGASQAGRNFISMLVNGITSGAGAIWNAVVGIAQRIWAGLGFHSPTEAGPGRDADRWMPNLVNMLSTSLIAGQPKMATAVQTVAQPLAILNQQSSSYPAPHSAAVLYAAQAAAAQSANSGGRGEEQHFHIYIGGQEIADITGNQMMRQTRRRTGMKV